MTIRKKRNVYKLITAILVYLACLMLSSITGSIYISAIAVMVLSIILVFEYRDNFGLELIFFFIAYANYSVVIGVYLFPSIRPAGLYDKISDSSIYMEAINSMLLFLTILFVAHQFVNTGRAQENYKIELASKRKANPLIELFCIAAYLIIFITQFRFNEDARASTSVLSEYRYMFMIFGCVYSDKTKIKKLIWILIIGITSMLTFFGGNRVNAFPGLFLLLLFWFPDFNLRKYLWLFPVVLIFLQMVGKMRYNFSLSIGTFVNGFQSAWREGFTSDSFTFAYYPSLTGIKLGRMQEWSIKLKLLLNNLIYIIRGGSYGNYVLPNYTHRYFLHYYGYFAPVYFNYWFGTVGAIAAAVIVWLFIKYSIYSKKASFFRYICELCVVASCPRWYCYNLLQLPRAFIFLIILYLGFETVDSIAKKYRRNKLVLKG